MVASVGPCADEASSLRPCVSGRESPEGECLVEESFLLRTLRDVVNAHILTNLGGEGKNGHTDLAPQSPLTSPPTDLDGRLETLWDLCADFRTASFLVREGRALQILSEAAMRAQQSAEDVSKDDQQRSADARSAEVYVGALANICTHREVVAGVAVEDVAALAAVAQNGLSVTEGSVVLQSLRLSVGLLMGPVATSCSQLLSGSAVNRYVYVVENSLLWEAVQQACNALSQGIVLESAGHEFNPTGKENPRSPISNLAKDGFVSVLADRVGEVASSLGCESLVHAGAGDAETALLSALCLGESLLSAATSEGDCGSVPIEDVVALAISCLRALAVSGRPDVVAADLELIATLLDWEVDSAILRLPVIRSKSDVSAVAIVPQVRACLGGELGPAVIEKLVFLLQDGAELDEDGSLSCASSAALVLLDLAPWTRVSEHADVLAPMAQSISEATCADIFASLSPDFLRHLGVAPVPCESTHSKLQSRSRSRSPVRDANAQFDNM